MEQLAVIFVCLRSCQINGGWQVIYSRTLRSLHPFFPCIICVATIHALSIKVRSKFSAKIIIASKVNISHQYYIKKIHPCMSLTNQLYIEKKRNKVVLINMGVCDDDIISEWMHVHDDSSLMSVFSSLLADIYMYRIQNPIS